MVQADFGFRTGVNPEGRLFNPVLGGGALLDVGIYPLSLAHMILGTPNRITSMAEMGSTGVDEQTAFILGYNSGQIAVLSTAIRTNTPHEATIIGTTGWIKIHSPWWISDTLTLKTDDGEQLISCPLVGNGYNYEAVEAGNCIRLAKLESDFMPLDETLALMKIMDEIRTQIGLNTRWNKVHYLRSCKHGTAFPQIFNTHLLPFVQTWPVCQQSLSTQQKRNHTI